MSAGTVAWLLHPARRGLALDRPNDRSLHSTPIPRVGGLGIMAGSLPALWWAGLPWVIALSAGALSALSFVDDRRGLPVGIRFGVHFAAAVVLLGWLSAVPWWGLPVLAVAVVWMTNLYNFMDGSDGLAGGMAVFGFGACAAGAAMAGDDALVAGAAGVAAASAGFLVFNFPPARVFMGDSGSIPLGFLAAALGLVGWSRGDWPLWFPVVVFGPFVADATVTLARRVVRGERIWQAHRTHYYQRLVQLGLGHRRTALLEYALMALSAGAAVWSLRAAAEGQGLVLTGLAAVYGIIAWQVDRRWVAFVANRDVP
jgi:phospho-N-acetylmuramoyl-pentapeptide-transferase